MSKRNSLEQSPSPKTPLGSGSASGGTAGGSVSTTSNSHSFSAGNVAHGQQRLPNSFVILGSASNTTAFCFPPPNAGAATPTVTHSTLHAQSGTGSGGSSGGSPGGLQSSESPRYPPLRQQSSDEYSTTMSSMRSRSTSSELFEEGPTCVSPLGGPTASRTGPAAAASGHALAVSLSAQRVRRASPLRKQHAVQTSEEEHLQRLQEHQRLSAEETTSTSLRDSPLLGLSTAISRFRTTQYLHGQPLSQLRRAASSGEERSLTAPEVAHSLSESEATIEPTTGCVFRKMTVRRQPPQSKQQQITAEYFQSASPNQPPGVSPMANNALSASLVGSRPVCPMPPMSPVGRVASVAKEPVHKSHSEGELLFN